MKDSKTHKINTLGLSLSLMACFSPSFANAADFGTSSLYTISTDSTTTYDFSFKAYDRSGDLVDYYLSYVEPTGYTTNESRVTNSQTDVIYAYGGITATSSTLQGGVVYVGNYSRSFTNVDFFKNSYVAGESSLSIYGGALAVSNNNNSEVTVLSGDFVGNSIQDDTDNSYYLSNAYGGAISNRKKISAAVYSNFIANYISASSGNAYGGAIYNNGSITSVEGDFIGNYVSAGNEALGGAVYMAAGSTIEFKASEGKSYSYVGNYAGTSDANGGFMYMVGTAAATFNVGESASITIGTSAIGYDSIASSNTNSSIEKTGAGTLTVYSSMASYTGSLTVSAGIMSINNSLGSTAISITQGASLYVQDIADSITLSVYLSGGSSIDALLSIGDSDSTSISTLSIYLDESFALGKSVVVYSDDSISIADSGSILVYYATDVEDVYAELSSDLYTFSNGTFTYASGIAVPEPSTYAMIFGVVALGFAAYRRRNQK